MRKTNQKTSQQSPSSPGQGLRQLKNQNIQSTHLLIVQMSEARIDFLSKEKRLILNLKVYFGGVSMVNQLISLAFVSCLIFGQKAWCVFPDDVQEASNPSLSSAAPSSQMPSSTPPEGVALPQVDGAGEIAQVVNCTGCTTAVVYQFPGSSFEVFLNRFPTPCTHMSDESIFNRQEGDKIEDLTVHRRFMHESCRQEFLSKLRLGCDPKTASFQTFFDGTFSKIVVSPLATILRLGCVYKKIPPLGSGIDFTLMHFGKDINPYDIPNMSRQDDEFLMTSWLNVIVRAAQQKLGACDCGLPTLKRGPMTRPEFPKTYGQTCRSFSFWDILACGQEETRARVSQALTITAVAVNPEDGQLIYELHIVWRRPNPTTQTLDAPFFRSANYVLTKNSAATDKNLTGFMFYLDNMIEETFEDFLRESFEQSDTSSEEKSSVEEGGAGPDNSCAEQDVGAEHPEAQTFPSVTSPDLS